MNQLTGRFIFVCAAPDSAAWLKTEMRNLHPDLTLAFNRPGLYTFKHTNGVVDEDFRLASVFARHFGLSLGQASTVDETIALIPRARGPMGLHVYSRDEGEDAPAAPDKCVADIRCELLSKTPDIFVDRRVVPVGSLVLDVIVPPQREPAEPWFIGVHKQFPNRSQLPGGVSRMTPPSHAPSRAWSKIEELIAWASIPMQKGHVALEIGCAPGGAVTALTDRGLHVVGIDPGAVDENVFHRASRNGGSFVHIRKPAADAARSELPSRVDWFLCDANLAPTVALRYVAYWSKQLRPKLRGIIFTLKLNDLKMVSAIPKLMKRASELGFGRPRAVQLPSNRKEITVLCMKPESPAPRRLSNEEHHTTSQ